MPPSYTLYAPAGSFRAFAPLIAAEYNGVEIDVETSAKAVAAAAKSKSPVGKAPLLQTPNGVIFSSGAMSRYVAGLRRDTGLLGNSLQEQASVDAWMDWTAQDVELPACVLYYPVAGYMPHNADA
jgi:elongation factor 1-gamma